VSGKGSSWRAQAWSRERACATLLQCIASDTATLAAHGSEAVLIIRSMVVRLPAADRQGNGRELELRVASAIESTAQNAHRPARGPVPPGAAAVLFADRSELLAVLQRDWLCGDLASAWWWKVWLAGRDIYSVLQQEGRHIAEAAVSARWQEPASAARAPAPAPEPALIDITSKHRFQSIVNASGPRPIGWPDMPLHRALSTASANEAFDPTQASLPTQGSEAFVSAALLTQQIASAGFPRPYTPLTLADAPRQAGSSRHVNNTDVAGNGIPEPHRLGGHSPGARAFLGAPRSASVAELPMGSPRLPSGLRRSSLRAPTEVAPRSSAGLLATRATEHGVGVNASAASAPPRSSNSVHPRRRRSAGIDPTVIALAAHPSLADHSAGLAIGALDEPDRGITKDPAPVVLASPNAKAPVVQGRATRFHASACASCLYLLNAAVGLGMYSDFTLAGRSISAPSPWKFVAEASRRISARALIGDAVWALLSSLDEETDVHQAPDRWAMPTEWLRPLRPSRPWHVRLELAPAGARLVVVHPAGFCVIDEPCEEGCVQRRLRELAAELDTSLPEVESVSKGRGQRRWIDWVFPYLAYRLHQALGTRTRAELARLLFHPGTLALSPGRLDVHLSLERLPIEIRLAGLDRNPGFIPAAGRIVEFHYA
jgi:hypothetical protein